MDYASMVFLVLMLAGCMGPLQRENTTLKARLEASQRGTEGLERQLEACTADRKVLMNMYGAARKRAEDPHLKDK